jgi:hypothetical protein
MDEICDAIDGLEVLRGEFLVHDLYRKFLFRKMDEIQNAERIQYSTLQQWIAIFQVLLFGKRKFRKDEFPDLCFCLVFSHSEINLFNFLDRHPQETRVTSQNCIRQKAFLKRI